MPSKEALAKYNKARRDILEQRAKVLKKVTDIYNAPKKKEES